MHDCFHLLNSYNEIVIENYYIQSINFQDDSNNKELIEEMENNDAKPVE